MSEPLTEGKLKAGNGFVKKQLNNKLSPIAPPPAPMPMPDRNNKKEN